MFDNIDLFIGQVETWDLSDRKPGRLPSEQNSVGEKMEKPNRSQLWVAFPPDHTHTLSRETTFTASCLLPLSPRKCPSLTHVLRAGCSHSGAGCARGMLSSQVGQEASVGGTATSGSQTQREEDGFGQ